MHALQFLLHYYNYCEYSTIVPQIQEDYSHLPRAAVAKYIEYCDICSLHRVKGSQQGKDRQARGVGDECGSETASEEVQTARNKENCEPRTDA